MTYSEACRVAEEASRWIRNADAERVVRLAQLEKAQAVIRQTLTIDPITIEPQEPDDPAPAVVLEFVHPADEPGYANGAAQ